MISKIVTLGDVCNKGSSNIAQKDLVDRDGIYPIYGAAGYIKNVDFAHQDKPYLAVVKDGAGIGRVMKLPANSSIIGTMQYILPKGNIDIDYLYFALQYMNLSKYFSGSTIPHIYFRDYQKEKLPLPELSEQQGKAYVLLRIEQLIECYHQQLTKLDELVKSQFVEMFGDPIDNPMGWFTKSLTSMGTCKNGMNFHNSDSGVEISCLGVGDFKDYSVIDGTSSLPTVSLNEMPPEDYLLRDEDIVFVRSNGNKTMVGRSVVVYPGDTPTTFSGFCIRYRNEDKSIAIPYLLRVLKTDSMRKQMYGRGANIQNLNQQILASLQIPVPPMELQEQYIAFVAQADKSKLAVQQAFEKLETLKKSLMQQYFG